MLSRYYNAMDLVPDQVAAFESWYRVLGAQRHCKVLGIFVRLWRRDGKDTYLHHLPRVARLLRSHLDSDELAPLSDWLRYETHFLDSLTSTADDTT
jgi:aminoglycoside/choline kinase family phosphotransferase